MAFGAISPVREDMRAATAGTLGMAFARWTPARSGVTVLPPGVPGIRTSDGALVFGDGALVIDDLPAAGGIGGANEALGVFTPEQFGKVDTPAAALGSIRAAIAAAKLNGGGLLDLSSTTYALPAATAENHVFFPIDFPNFSVRMAKGGQVKPASANFLSYLFYVTKKNFSAEGFDFLGADGGYLNSFGTKGVKVFTLTNDDSDNDFGNFEIADCRCKYASTLVAVNPKGKPVRGIRVSGFADSTTYGFNSNESVYADGILISGIVEITGRNVYRRTLVVGPTSGMRFIDKAMFGRELPALGNGTGVNITLPTIAGIGNDNLFITSNSDDDWSRGVILVTQTTDADIAAGGTIYGGRAWRGVRVQATCTRGSYTLPTNDYTGYIGHINKDTGATTSTPLAVTYSDVEFEVNSPSDLTLGRLPMYAGFETSIPPRGMILRSTAELSAAFQTANLETLAAKFADIVVAGRRVVSGAMVVRDSAGVSRTVIDAGDAPHIAIGAATGSGSTRWNSPGDHAWLRAGSLQKYMSGTEEYPWTDLGLSAGNASKRYDHNYSRSYHPGDGTVAWTSGAGSPEGAVTAPVGSLYTRTDGGADTTLYVKESGSGNTGWAAQ